MLSFSENLIIFLLFLIFRFNVNYGASGWMDWLFGTDASFKETINNERHRTLYTFESAREMFPDAQNNRDASIVEETRPKAN